MGHGAGSLFLRQLRLGASGSLADVTVFIAPGEALDCDFGRAPGLCVFMRLDLATPSRGPEGGRVLVPARSPVPGAVGRAEAAAAAAAQAQSDLAA